MKMVMRYGMFLPLEITGSTLMPDMIKGYCYLLHDLYQRSRKLQSNLNGTTARVIKLSFSLKITGGEDIQKLSSKNTSWIIK